jgi:hypothetical protein
MAYSHLASQDTLNTASTTSVTTTYGAVAQAGDLLIATVFATGVGLGTTAITGWTSAASISWLSSVDETSIFYLIATGVESAITATCSGATSMVLAIHEFQTGNIQAAQTLEDQSTTGSATLNTTLAIGSITPTKTNELIIAAIGFPTGGTSAWSWGQGLTLMSSNANLMDGFIVDQNVNAINATGTWTGSSTSGGAVASFFAGSTGDAGANYSSPRKLIVGNGMSVGGEAN